MAARPGTSPAPPTTLGDLPFELDAASVRRRGLAELRQAQERLDELLALGEVPSTANLLRPLDLLLLRASDVGEHGSFIFSVHPDAETRAAGREISEASDAFFHALRLNERAYLLLGAIDLASADEPTRFAVEKMRRDMRRAGVEKDVGTRTRLLELNRAIDVTCNQFAENIAKLVRWIDLDSEAQLEGLPPDYRAAHRPSAGGRIRITTQYPDVMPAMTYADDPEVRRRLLHEFLNRAYPENVEVLETLLQQRHEFARLLGYRSYAAYAIEDKMVATPEAARALLERARGLLDRPARLYTDRVLARKQRDHPEARRLELWDSRFLAGSGYYDEKIRTEEFGVDLKALRPYLPYGAVRDGLFTLCGELFGLAFDRVPDAARPHPSIEVYDVAQHGTPVGRIYLDMTPREGKFSHAACFPVRGGLAGVQLSQTALVCNFLDPGVPMETARLEYSNVITFFHEFGHLLHRLLSAQPRWSYNSASHLEWDFIEAPSQLFEEWARDPGILGRFARDPDSGDRIPAELLHRLKASESLGRPAMWLRQAGLAAISLELYDHDPAGRITGDVVRETFGRYSPEPLSRDYHFEEAFGHLTGYSAFYYTYLWSVVIARDLVGLFLEKGSLTDPEIAARYAREILAPGSERPAAELVRAYLGREFNFDAFERWVTAPARAPVPEGDPRS
jgi:thimet oligopeptidase